jgi:hypothetical protein
MLAVESLMAEMGNLSERSPTANRGCVSMERKGVWLEQIARSGKTAATSGRRKK